MQNGGVSGRALKVYTACYDGKLEEVKRLVEEPTDEPLDVNAEIHGGTAFAAAVQVNAVVLIKMLNSFVEWLFANCQVLSRSWC
mmetsp:Transcript_747/g.954  ORF Transcript_747/g.954 Transcript_747/m.954 type:complete len:84 (+) Transcript_747:44-295(+)